MRRWSDVLMHASLTFLGMITTFISAWICEMFQARDLHFVAVTEGASTSTRQHRRLAPGIGGPERNNTFSARRGLRTACYDLNIPRSSKGKLVGFGSEDPGYFGWQNIIVSWFPIIFPWHQLSETAWFHPLPWDQSFPPIHQAEMQRSVRRNATFAPGSADRCGAWSWELQTLSIQAAASWGFQGNWVLRLGWKVA